MATWREVYQKYLDCSDEERKEEARRCTANILDVFKRHFNDSDAVSAFFGGLAVFVCADGVVNTAEYEFITDYTGINIDYDSFYELVKGGASANLVTKFDEMLDSNGGDFKTDFVSLGLCICACNGTMTVDEQRLIERLMAE